MLKKPLLLVKTSLMTYYSSQSFSAIAKQPSSIMKKSLGGTQHKENSIHFKETPNVQDYQSIEAEEEFKKEYGRFYHIMMPYKNYLVVYGG